MGISVPHNLWLCRCDAHRQLGKAGPHEMDSEASTDGTSSLSNSSPPSKLEPFTLPPTGSAAPFVLPSIHSWPPFYTYVSSPNESMGRCDRLTECNKCIRCVHLRSPYAMRWPHNFSRAFPPLSGSVSSEILLLLPSKHSSGPG